MSKPAISTSDIAAVVRQHLEVLASQLRPDVEAALVNAIARERNPQAKVTLELLLENAHLAADKGVPSCQDTGTVWVLIEAGSEAQVDFAGLQEALNLVVAEIYESQGLRASTVRDALSDRRNPGTNTPAFVEYVRLATTGQDRDYRVVVSTMLKGAGSDNASSVVMISPGSTSADIVAAVCEAVREKASRACPPLVIGIGIGSTFDKVAGLSKRALLRPLDQTARIPEVAALEAEVLKAVNETGVGPAGLGGDTTALAVAIETAPSHIASLPLAINLSCHALRSRTSLM
ncbi:MAG: fumarate hydratase [Coriobacteriia bacterium]|nr:fumarate hydratase [Coriobacteriia bacterium]MCL2537081.1 fumarate hydratase [Coriobacteriia bacterium]